VASDYSVMTWLLSSIYENVSANVLILKTTKTIWDTLKEMNSNEQSISRIPNLYKKLFSLRQDGRSV